MSEEQYSSFRSFVSKFFWIVIAFVLSKGTFDYVTNRGFQKNTTQSLREIKKEMIYKDEFLNYWDAIDIKRTLEQKPDKDETDLYLLETVNRNLERLNTEIRLRGSNTEDTKTGGNGKTD